MKNVRENIEQIRQWFIEHETYFDEIATDIYKNYEKLMGLLDIGNGARITPLSFESLFYLFNDQKGRMLKIKTKGKVILTAEPEKSTKQVYQSIRNLIIMLLLGNDQIISRDKECDT